MIKIDLLRRLVFRPQPVGLTIRRRPKTGPAARMETVGPTQAGRRALRVATILPIAFLIVGVGVGGTLLIKVRRRTPAIAPTVPRAPTREQATISQTPSLPETLPATASMPRGGTCLELLDEARRAIPPFVWLTSISSNPLGEYFVQGIAFSRERVMAFREGLQQVSAVRQIEMSLFRKGTLNGSPAFQFSLRGRATGPPDTAYVGTTPLTDEEIERLSRSIREQGETLGLAFTAVSPLEKLSEGLWSKRHLKLWARGRYAQADAFLTHLRSLPPSVSVSQFVLTPADTIAPNLDRVSLFVAMDVYSAVSGQ